MKLFWQKHAHAQLKASPLIFLFGLVAIITTISLLGLHKINARAYSSLFNFAGTDRQKKVGVLSGASGTACTSHGN